MNNTKIIEDIKSAQGGDLVIMGHHYQKDEVVTHCDLRGDSLELARQVPGLRARTIVFCGVTFMAETAAMLSSDSQRVLQPSPDAGCVMSNMAPAMLLDCVLERLTRDGRRVTPLAYVNTDAAIKAVVGRHGGSVCTSANAEVMLRWALDQGDGVLFLPDTNLGTNTANRMGLRPDKLARLDIRGGGANIDAAALADKDLLLWPGLCAVHQRFKVDQIRELRQRDPDALVVVHPECAPEVVDAADADGSTSMIIKYVAQAPEGSAIYIGTEISLVERLAKQYRGVKQVRPLFPSQCSNMAKTTEKILARTLQDMDTAQAVCVPAEVAEPATIAIQRMLDACA